MGYTLIWKNYQINIISMAAFVAWLWFFPLFGILQTALPDSNGKLTVFNLTFLFATILGYLVFLSVRNRPLLKPLIAFSAPITAAFTILTAFAAWSFPPHHFWGWGTLSAVLFILFPAAMGMAGAIYFAFWGTSIFHVPPDQRGRYMAAMVAAATVFYAALVGMFTAAPLPALFLSGLALLAPSLFLKKLSAFIDSRKNDSPPQNRAHPTNQKNHEKAKPWKAFWLPFSLTILCFYILAWATHDIIFSAIKAEGTLFPIIGQSFYALIFLFAGFFLDREKEIEKVAVLGLILLGCTFLLLPVALSFDIISPLYFLLEASYGFIDLFMWVSLAYFCHLLRGDPKQYYSLGLMLNILFIMAGIFLMPLIDINIEGGSYYLLSLAAGILLFFGLLPTLSLRKIRLDRQEQVDLPDIIDQEIGKLNIGKEFQMEVFTQKEKEILYLMLAGSKNNEIIEKLQISKNTLKTHVRHIYGKAGVQNRSELLFKFAHLINNSEP